MTPQEIHDWAIDPKSAYWNLRTCVCGEDATAHPTKDCQRFDPDWGYVRRKLYELADGPIHGSGQEEPDGGEEWEEWGECTSCGRPFSRPRGEAWVVCSGCRPPTSTAPEGEEPPNGLPHLSDEALIRRLKGHAEYHYPQHHRTVKALHAAARRLDPSGSTYTEDGHRYCSTCGTMVELVSSDEGTSYYRPVRSSDKGERHGS